ncbi:hypothetical protein AZF04_02940 [Alkalihalobacillus trypoxylicola]|uniref:Uncharacterized protein n=1 Tax=Alkalihalobacillus trypoxylicola TaxID=519424 RepID=A0A162FCR2_9BACI|nr:hypothetical protein AZF04_02940 [Alkalihalobacillus trypoxylicola]
MFCLIFLFFLVIIYSICLSLYYLKNIIVITAEITETLTKNNFKIKFDKASIHIIIITTFSIFILLTPELLFSMIILIFAPLVTNIEISEGFKGLFEIFHTLTHLRFNLTPPLEDINKLFLNNTNLNITLIVYFYYTKVIEIIFLGFLLTGLSKNIDFIFRRNT